MSETNRSKLTAFVACSYRKLVCFVQQKINDSADRSGEDIVQDVVLHILDKADVMAPIENLSAYLFRALRNKIVDEMRKPDRMIESLEKSVSQHTELKLIDIIQDLNDDPAQALEREERLDQIYNTLDSLPPRQKMVIMETEFQGVSFRELSERLSVPIGTLLASKSRGIKSIRKTLNSGNISEEKNNETQLV